MQQLFAALLLGELVTRAVRVSQAFSSCGHANLVWVFQRLAGKSPLLPRGIESFDLLTPAFTRRF